MAHKEKPAGGDRRARECDRPGGLIAPRFSARDSDTQAAPRTLIATVIKNTAEMGNGQFGAFDPDGVRLGLFDTRAEAERLVLACRAPGPERGR